MATAASITTDWTTCPICLDVFDNPKSLPCIHGFCLKCLQGHFKDKCVGDEVPCPLCRKEFKIPPDGLDGLQHHFFIQHLVDARNVSSKSAGEVPCESCLEFHDGNEGDIPPATVYCVDCSEKLCEKCSRPHRRSTMKGGPHQVRPLRAELEQELIQLRASSCDKHKEEKVKLYCHECVENICLMCSAVKHKQHETADIADVAERFRPRMADDDKQVLSNINAARQQSELMKEALVSFHTTLAGLEKETAETGEAVKKEFCSKVDQQVSECLGELQSVKVDSTKQSEMVQEQLQLALVAMESFHTYSRELLDKGRPSDITRAASELHKRATELLAGDVTSAEYWPPNVTFTPADVTQLMRSQLVGQVSTHRSDDKTVGQALHTLPEPEPVVGMTLLDSLLYLLRDTSTEQVEVYDIASHCLHQCINVLGLDRMSDMIGCAHNHCLYIAGADDKCVHRVGLVPNAGTCKWPVDDYATRLSLTDTHGVLVTCHKVSKIKEFSTDGKLLRQVQLAPDIVTPRHTIQLFNGQFLVAHGDLDDSTNLHRVCLVGSDGHLVKSYGGPKGAGNQQVNGPYHLAIDRNGYIFVADVNNCRVLLLSPALTYVRDVVTRDQLKWRPVRLCLDVDRRSLNIADCQWKDGKFVAGRAVVVRV